MDEFRQERELKVNESSQRDLQAASVYRVTAQQLVRHFTFDYYDESIPRSKQLKQSEIQAILDVYMVKQLNFEADQDRFDYSPLRGTDYDDEEKRAAWFYTNYPPQGYFVDFPNPQYIKIKMKIDPCRVYGTTDLCCNGANESVCEDNTVITSGTDIGVAWFTNGFVMRCSTLY